MRQLSIETSALKASGLGKIVYFYTKCKRVEPFIKRMADQLVSDCGHSLFLPPVEAPS